MAALFVALWAPVVLLAPVAGLLAGAIPVLAALAGLALEAAAPRHISPAPGEELARPAT